MKAAFCTNVFGNTKEAMAEAIPRLAEMGYDGLEFWEQYLAEADLSWLRDFMDAHKLEIVQICPYFDFTEGKAKWDESLKIAERYVGYSLQLGRPMIRTYTGNVGSADATKEQWDACVDGLQSICEMGKPHGIIFALETHQVIHSGPNLTDTSDSTLKLLADVGQDNLKLNLQTPLVNESITFSAEQLGEHVIHLHAHNWIIGWPAAGGRLTFLDSGDEDFAEFVRVLKSKGFDGYISIEHGSHHPPYETAEHEIKYLKRLIAGEWIED